jgi:uncharacterized integral membrane protein (TIGR00698 family)
MLPQILFVSALLIVAGLKSPPIALVVGLVFGLAFTHPFPKQAKSYSKTLLQVSVVGLGFGMNLHEVLRAGRSGFVYTALGIAATLALGIGLGRLLRVEPTAALLISVGTAICGGSAIAAVGPVAGAREEEMSVSLGTVFILNSVALLVFPDIGAFAGLDQTQFGLWAALAIHDTSSVVGAAAKYGAVALAVGTTVKLARALWIVPLTIGTALVRRQAARIQWPWFILFFCVAAIANTYLAGGRELFAWLGFLARIGLTVTLFLIGSSISIATLKKVGVRPFLQGVLLWLVVGAGTLLLIRAGWIGL